MNPIVEARASLFDAIADAFSVSVDGYEFAGRVTDTKPDKLTAPWVYIGETSGATARGQNATSYRVGFPVWVVYDGAQTAQVRGIDEVIGRLIAAAQSSSCNVTGHSPQPPDVPNPGTWKAAVITVEISAYFHNFRPITLMEAASA